jgi:NADH-quinone oxidoreductase subunit M
VKAMLDLSPREILVFAPLVALVLWIGIYPTSFLRPIQPSVGNLVERVENAQAAQLGHPPSSRFAGHAARLADMPRN